MFELLPIIGFNDCVDSIDASCTPSRQLLGTNWQDHTTVALFAIDILTCLVLFACIGLATQFKWATGHGLDHVKSIGYVIATAAMLLDFITILVNTGLSEQFALISNHYYVLYIFNSLGWRVGELLILAIVLSIIHHRFHIDRQSTSNFGPFVSPAIIVSIMLIALISAADWAIYVAYNAKLINNIFYSGNLLSRKIDVDLAYKSLYLLVTLFALVPIAVLFLRERSFASIVLLGVILPTLILRTLTDLVSDIISYFNTSATLNTIVNFDWATSFIYDFTTMVIFLGVAIVAMQKPQRETARKNSRDNGYGEGVA